MHTTYAKREIEGKRYNGSLLSLIEHSVFFTSFRNIDNRLLDGGSTETGIDNAVKKCLFLFFSFFFCYE